MARFGRGYPIQAVVVRDTDDFVYGSTSFSASANLGGIAGSNVQGSATISAQANQVSVASVIRGAVIPLSGQTNLISLGGMYRLGAAEFSGSSEFEASGGKVQEFGEASFVGESELEAVGTEITEVGTASFSAQVEMTTVGGEYLVSEPISFSASSDSQVSGIRVLLSGAEFDGEGILTDIAIGQLLGQASLVGDTTLISSSSPVFARKADFSAISNLEIEAGASRLGYAVFSARTRFTAPPEPQPPLWHRVNLEDDWSFVRGAARLLLSPMTQDFPEQISDIIDLNTYDPVGEWEDAGATKSGINFGLEGAEETIAINQITGLIEPDPHNWKYGFSTQLAENTLEHLQTSWELGSITSVGANERKAGYGSTVKLSKKRVAVVFKNPKTGLIRAFAFRKATIAPQDRISVFNKTGEQNVIPVQFTLYPDFNIRDIKKRFFTVFEQVN